MSQAPLPSWNYDLNGLPTQRQDLNRIGEVNVLGGRNPTLSSNRSTPQAPNNAARAKPTFGQFVNEPRGNDLRNSMHNSISDERRDGYLERDSVFDEFKYRELCLNAASRTKMVTTYLTKIKDHILKEASLEWEAAASYGAFMDQNENESAKYGRSYLSSAPVPKEALILENSSTELQGAAGLCMKAVSECFQSRKTIYLTQLKKIRDTSNMATRNAVQHERSEAATFLNRLRESLEAQRRQEVRSCEDKIVALENAASSLHSALETAKTEQARLTELEQNRVHLQAAAVAAALEQCRREHAQDRERLQAGWAAERARLLEDTQAQVEDMKRQNETHVEAQRHHEREMRELILQDKARAEAETAKVREDLIQTSAKLASERERSAVRLQEERERAERDQQAALAEAVKGQALLRAELASTVQRMQMDEMKRNALQDQDAVKYREQLLTQHALEVEKVNERHRNEMKKYQAELQVRHQDAVSKLKHVHEQEINRLIRDNERLHRIIVRHGGAEAFRNVDAVLPGTAFGDAMNATVDESVNASFFNATQSPGLQFSARKSPLSKAAKYTSSIRHSLTPSPNKLSARAAGGGMRSPDRSSAVGGVAGASVAAGTGGAGGKRGVNFGGAVDGERPLSDKYAPASADAGTETYREQRASSARVPESPPPPPPSSSRQAKLDGVKWGALAESLRLQEEDSGKPKYSSTHMPPDAFALDASLAAARSATNRKLGVGIRGAAESNLDYAKELDRYLRNGGTDRGKADGPTPISIIRELPGALGSVLETSSHSSGNFNALADHTYNRERTRMGLGGSGRGHSHGPSSPGYDSDSCDPSSDDDDLAGEDITLSATKGAAGYR